jgi:hypothetical protein
MEFKHTIITSDEYNKTLMLVFTTIINLDDQGRLIVFYDKDLLSSRQADKVWHDQVFIDQLRCLLIFTGYSKRVDVE